MKSRRTLFIIFISILIFSNLISIDEKGLKIGLSYSNITGKHTFNSEFTPSFVGGIFLNKQLNNWLSLQTELLISIKGSKYEGKERLFLDNDADGSFDEDPFDQIDNDGDG